MVDSESEEEWAKNPRTRRSNGFALVVTVSLMVLLAILGVGMLALSTVSLRSSARTMAMAEARANARLAMMIAIGELQKQLGPDMRISAEAAIHDSNPETGEIDGVAQPHWTAVYDSWGNWLNAEYTPEGKAASDVSTIADTYVAKRATMFRRWLVSLPENIQTDVNAAAIALDHQGSVIMVGEGTLGRDHTAENPQKVTRAYKIRSGESGAYAWWVSPENHKAKINLAAQKRELSADQWATAQGAASEVAIGGIEGFENLDSSNDEAEELANRLMSLKTLELPSFCADQDMAKSKFFDLTESSAGILSNTRSGGLKKDLSLLFENTDTTIAPQYTQANRLAPEPSIRPHSKDVLAYNADLPRRPFASWPRMRHFYRMYRSDTDTALPGSGVIDQRERNLKHADGVPYTGVHAPDNMREFDKNARWFGENSYLRFPVLARFLLIHAYQTERYFESRGNAEEIAFHYYDVPVVTLWNPYSTPLTFNSGEFGAQIGTPHAWPNKIQFYNADGSKRGSGIGGVNHRAAVPIKSSDGSPIVFQPGEFKVFSFKPGVFLRRRDEDLWRNPDFGLFEGFDPGATGGLTDGGDNWWKRISDNGILRNLSFEISFDRSKQADQRPANCSEGNSPGSLTFKLGRGSDWKDDGIPSHYQIDWFQNSQLYQSITRDELGGLIPLIESEDPLPVGYSLLTLKTVNRLATPASWARDWRCRNWLHAPPYNFGGGLYMTEHSEARAHTQRLDSSYEVSFGPTSPSELVKLTGEIDGKPWLGFGSNPFEKVTAVPAIELPTAPICSLASFSGMRISPGWIWAKDLNPDWEIRQRVHEDVRGTPVSLYNAYSKHYAYQSGITGGGIGNSFIHPMIPREEVYFRHDNSKSQEHVRMDLLIRTENWAEVALTDMKTVETKAYSDYWDHVLMLNDALWDEYFISSIANQTRPWATDAENLQANIEALTDGGGLPISRYQYHAGGIEDAEVQQKLNRDDAYLRASEHLLVDGAFNVNSTSVDAWYALFKGIRERKVFFRGANGNLSEIRVPEGHIALSRFDTPTTDRETSDISMGVARDDGYSVWSGVRFISDAQIRLLAEECVEQVKRRGPFLNFSEFINRRLEDSDLGLMGALQSAIDFDDAEPDSSSVNYRYKNRRARTIEPSDLGSHEFNTPEAVEGSRFAGIPGYVMQADLLKPIANTLQVRDDTFRIRGYGESLDSEGNVIARVWCEAIVQRTPEYTDGANAPHEPSFLYEGDPDDDSYDPGWDGEYVENANLSPINRRFGRKFEIVSFRWLAGDEV